MAPAGEPHHAPHPPESGANAYDEIAELYDSWAMRLTEDRDFYVAEALKSGGPVVELGVGTGRIAIAIALAGLRVIGVDASASMLAQARHAAADAGVEDLFDLRLGDFRAPPVAERVPLVTCPFRSFEHLLTDTDRRQAFTAVRDMLEPGGRFIFDVAVRTPEVASRGTREWEELRPGVWERVRWDEDRRVMELGVRLSRGEVTRETQMSFARLGRDEWRDELERSGFDVLACYGWFDRRPCGSLPPPHAVWVTQPAL